jgi:hypothetical protein
VLWSRSFTPEASHLATSAVSPVNSLIREALIEGRTTDERYEKDGYAVKWTFVNDLELIFVVRSFPSVDSLTLQCEAHYSLGRVPTYFAVDIRGRTPGNPQDSLRAAV